MKKFLIRTLFKKEFTLIHDYYQKKIENIKKETELKLEELKKSCEIPKRIFYLFKNAEILGIEINKEGEELFVFKEQTESSVYIKLCGESYKAINGMPMIDTNIRKNPYPKPSELYINDIRMIHNEIGNGSIAMEYLIKTAKKMNVSHIRGWLSPEDMDHFDRLEHYYTKFGFKVVFNKERTSGNIELTLK
ncbi:hypothetical protein [Bacillus cereus]|uniref:hypothetical protein n=1 Tax=Bacillus cereus TaxID=1396 RepID=UPI00116559D8|nr:hypothetical protein [Bacillus cereus]QDD87447.1 hypothetical protein FORC087_664 [Bacillus cereus]